MANLDINVDVNGINKVNALNSSTKKLEQQVDKNTIANKKLTQSYVDLAKEQSRQYTKTELISNAYADLHQDMMDSIDDTTLLIKEKKELNKQTQKEERYLSALENQHKKSTNASNKFSLSLKSIAVGALAYIAIDRLIDSTIRLGKEFINTADDMTLANSRLSLVTNGTEELRDTQEKLFDVAQNSRVELTTTIDLYSQMARSTSALNITQDRLLNVTNNISKSLTISGGSADSANAAIFQLNQGFASGVLRGQELNSVMEQTPRLSQAIADGLGLTIGQLREVANQGELTTERVITALESQSSAINEEFGKISTTVEQGNLLIENASKKAIASLNEEYEITKSIANAQVALSMAATETFNIMASGFADSTDKSVWFAEATLTGMKWLITAAGEAYDSFESLGDVFSFIGKSGEFAFYGLVSGISFVAGTIGKMFESLTNDIIGMINVAINGINMIGGNIPTIGRVDFSSQNLSNASIAGSRALQAGQDLEAIRLDFANESTTGRDTAKLLTDEIDFALEELISRQATESVATKPTTTPATTINTSPTSNAQDEFLAISDALNEFGNTFSNQDLQSIKDTYSDNSSISQTIDEMLRNRSLEDSSTSNLQEEIKKQEEYTQKMLEDMDTTREEISDTNDTIKDTTDSFKDFNDLIYNDDDSVNDSINNVTDSFNNFGDSANNVDYSVSKATKALEKFIFQFSDTLFDSLRSNASTLDSIGKQSAFTSISYNEALQKAIEARNNLTQNVLNKDIGAVYEEAYNQFVTSATDYLNPSNFTSSSDYRFAQATVGTQAGQFESTAEIASQTLTSMDEFLTAVNTAVADDIIDNNEQIELQKLAMKTQDSNNALLLLGLKNVAGTVDNQEYYNNSGLATDKSLTGTDSVQSVIKSLMGTGESQGISINGLVSGVNALSVATGLDVSALSNIKKATEYMTDQNSTSLKNLQVSKIETQQQFVWSKRNTDGSIKSRVSHLDQGTGWIAGKEAGTIQTYTYVGDDSYADGGFTGNGMGKKDSSGYRQAGIVHEGEYVAPKWMVDSQPQIFNALESARKSKGFAQGGYTSTMKATTSNDMGGSMHILINEMQKLNATFNRVTENGESMSVILRAG